MVRALGEALQDGHRITASADAPLLSGQDPRGLTLPPLSHHLEELDSLLPWASLLIHLNMRPEMELL